MKDQKSQKDKKQAAEEPKYFWGFQGRNFAKLPDGTIYQPIPDRPNDQRECDGPSRVTPIPISVKRDWFDLAGWMVSLVTFIVVGIYTYYAGGQLREMIKATKASQEAANANVIAATAAEGAVDLARRQFRQDQRPYVITAPVEVTSSIQLPTEGRYAGRVLFQMKVDNYGKSPAIVSSAEGRIAVGEEEIKYFRFAQPNSDLSVIAPGDKPVIFVTSRVLSDEQKKTFGTKNSHMVIFVHIRYTDIFDAPHPTYEFFHCSAISFSAGPAVSDDKPDSICNGKNYIK